MEMGSFDLMHSYILLLWPVHKSKYISTAMFRYFTLSPVCK